MAKTYVSCHLEPATQSPDLNNCQLMHDQLCHLWSHILHDMLLDLCVSVCACEGRRAHFEVRGQFSKVGSFLPFLSGFQGSNSNHRAYTEHELHTVPSCCGSTPDGSEANENHCFLHKYSKWGQMWNFPHVGGIVISKAFRIYSIEDFEFLF